MVVLSKELPYLQLQFRLENSSGSNLQCRLEGKQQDICRALTMYQALLGTHRCDSTNSQVNLIPCLRGMSTSEYNQVFQKLITRDYQEGHSSLSVIQETLLKLKIICLSHHPVHGQPQSVVGLTQPSRNTGQDIVVFSKVNSGIQ